MRSLPDSDCKYDVLFAAFITVKSAKRFGIENFQAGLIKKIKFRIGCLPETYVKYVKCQ